jgi:hypothetical protein
MAALPAWDGMDLLAFTVCLAEVRGTGGWKGRCGVDAGRMPTSHYRL